MYKENANKFFLNVLFRKGFIKGRVMNVNGVLDVMFERVVSTKKKFNYEQHVKGFV